MLENKQNSILRVLIGPSGTGKTEYTKTFIDRNQGWVRVNRDDLRKQILGHLNPSTYYSNNNAQLEKHITVLQLEQIRYWLSQNLNVIVDNTHLKRNYLTTYLDNFSHLADVEFVPVITADVESCKARVFKRDGLSLDKLDYIDRQWSNYNHLINTSDDIISKYHYKNNNLKNEFANLQKHRNKSAIIVDIDGTISDCTGIRSPYDGEKLHLDKVIEPTKKLLKSLTKKSYLDFLFRKKVPTIIYLSGRDGKMKNDTIKWLIDNDFPWDGHLYTRAENDSRADYIIKKELLFRHVAPNFKIDFVLDDRLQVCHNTWYKLGIFVFNVNQGLKIF